MLAGIADHRTHRRRRVAARAEQSGDREDQTGQTRRKPVDRIVQPGRDHAVGGVAFGPVADHRIHGVDRLVGKNAGQTEQDVPEGGRDDGVGEVLGQAFQCRPRDTVPVQCVRIAADQMAQVCARRQQVALAKRLADVADPAGKAALRQQHRDQRHFGDPQMRVVEHGLMNGVPDTGAERGNEQAGDRAAHRPVHVAASLAVQLAVEKADQPADQHHRVRHKAEEPAHITDQPVQQQGKTQKKRRVLDQPTGRLKIGHALGRRLRHDRDS